MRKEKCLNNMGKTAIITGCNRGIGKELIKRFAEDGFDIWACARKESVEFKEFIAMLSSSTKRRITPVYFDLEDEKQVEQGIKNILSEKIDIDVLINNAAIAHGGIMAMTSLEKMKEVYQVNVFSQVKIMQLVSRKMMRQKSGCIINMCSVGGIEAEPGYLAYGSSKAALIWITKSISKELGMYGIRVNGIAPGLIDTDMGNYKNEEEMKKVLERMSIPRMGKVEEVSKMASFLASEEAAFITGQIFVVDGGRI